MEIKSVLNKPYTAIQRLDFIVEQNHNNGYEIRETDESLQAWGLTQEEKDQQELDRISHLKCTKRVLALILQELGIPYSQLKAIISSNEQAQLEWDLCIELERSNPLIDIIGAELGLTPKDIDNIFKYANGEINTIQKEGE
jgi:hypothetical protein